MGFGTSIKERRIGREGTFFRMEGGIESVFDEAFTEVGDGVAMTMKLLGNSAIGDSAVLGFIDGEEDIGVFNFLGVAFAGGNELDKRGAFVGGQGNFVNLLHGTSVCVGGKAIRITNAKNVGKRKMHKNKVGEVLV